MLTSEGATLIGTIVAALVAAVVTAAGWLITHRQNRKLALLRERLDLVNRQLSEFYGPLYISCESGRAAYEALLRKLNRTTDVFEANTPVSQQDLSEWYDWMQHVFMPINERRERIILEKSHLIREDHAPQAILDYAAHVTTYRAIMTRWARKDFSQLYSHHYPFPVELDSYARTGFAELKREQAELIGLIHKRRLLSFPWT